MDHVAKYLDMDALVAAAGPWGPPTARATAGAATDAATSATATTATAATAVAASSSASPLPQVHVRPAAASGPEQARL